MNKIYFLAVCFLPITISVNAQQSKTSLLYQFVTEQRLHLRSTVTIKLFTKSISQASAKIDATLSEKLILSLNRQASLDLFKSRPNSISLIIPSLNGNDHTLELIQQDINDSKEFVIGTIEGKGITKKTAMGQGLHYRGYINGDPFSIASFSVFANGEIMAVFSNETGNFNLGKAAGDIGEYILYNSKDMLARLGFECATSKFPPRTVTGHKDNQQRSAPPVANVLPPVLCKKVRIYWEADYKLYSNNFGLDLTNTVDYLTGLFNQVAVMYQNEGIVIELTATYIWITPDSYNTVTSSNGLDDFQARWNALGDNFNADLAVVIDGAPTTNGGVAYLLTDELCDREYAYGYVDMYGFYNSVPVYSWDVEVVTHEMGHLMGSHHTQWCGWNTGSGGACGAIDNCYSIESSGGFCTTCNALTNTNPSAPPGFQGTVMSYCHLRSGIGINLSYGFGPLPQAVIRSTVNGAACPLYDNKWTGALSTAWENAANWSCGRIPDIKTDVTIPTGLTNYPVINSAALCRRITQQPNTSVLVNTNFTLLVAGQP